MATGPKEAGNRCRREGATFEFSELTNGTLTYYARPGGRSMVLEAYFNSWSTNVTPVK